VAPGLFVSTRRPSFFQYVLTPAFLQRFDPLRTYPNNPCLHLLHRKFGTFSEKKRKEEPGDPLLSIIVLEGGISESLPHQREKGF